MKKKSLLILPVLLLALAACNKEEEVEVPEDDGTVVQPSGDDETGGTTEGGDEKEDEEEQIDARISLTVGSVILNPTEGEEGVVTGVEYANPETGLYIAETTVDEEGNVTYVLGGTPSTMSDTQATDFWSGHAKEGDKYIVINVAFNPDEEAVSWVSSAGDTRVRTAKEYPDGSMDVIIRISGKDVSEDKHAGTTTYTIGEVPAEDAEEVTGVEHIVDFSALLPGIALTKGPVELNDDSGVYYANPSDGSLSISSGVEGNGSVTYTVTGTPSTMCEGQAADFKGSATTETKYIVLTITFASTQTVSWTVTEADGSTDKRERTVANYPDCELNMIVAIYDDGKETVSFTIGDSTTSVDYIVDVSALMSTTQEQG